MTAAEEHEYCERIAYHICPFCGDEKGDEYFACCGEYGHGVNLTQQQYDEWQEQGTYLGDFV